MILNVEGLEFKYPSNTILNNISFSIKKGECLAILGTNGAGKSTLLKCLNKILNINKGNIFIDNISLKNLKGIDLAKKIGYVSQDSQVSRLTVFDSVLIGRKPYIKWNITDKDLKIVSNVLKSLNLEKFSLRYLDELSGGEVQKILIARALVQDTDILMLDEPTSNLDLKNQLEVINIIKRIIKDRKISTIVTIHDLNLALKLADKFIFLKNGSIYAAGGKEILTSENIEKVYSVPVKVRKFEEDTYIIPA